MCAVKYFQNHRSRADCFYTFFSSTWRVLIFWVLTNGFDVISASSDLHSSEDTEFEETSILKRYSHENRGCRPLNKLHSIPIS